MALTEEDRRAKQREYNRRYYLAHRERKLEQNARSAKRWREHHPDRYRESQERTRARVRALKGIEARKPKIRECSVCHDVKPHKARDMCVVCYGKWRWQNHKRIIETYTAQTGQTWQSIGEHAGEQEQHTRIAG
jgi:recombinational DNA repair protein RecR